jgi:D-alanyl-lipoteichoic acid acyltransferase DltB (MBOAT superfamily)
MLFNSVEFIFAFLPATLIVFFVLGARSRSGALGWLIAASLLFYAWWRPINVLIIAPSIGINYALARTLQRLGAEGARARTATAVLVLGIVFNVCFLGYFKYLNFAAGAINDLAGTQFVFERIILPLGISFITFQKIAFLIDVHGRRIDAFTLREYGLFVLFFPQLIAGPIVHFREMMPQFRRVTCRFDAEHVAVGLTLFAFGLFKKVVLADGIASHVTPLYDAAGAAGPVGFVAGWVAAVGFTLQIYFDFSGYSDMALGLARCFGVRLPPNFDSPLKASSIIDFWLRWHMTLTRFLTAYLYNPLVLWLTRGRLARGRPALGGRNPSAGAFVALLAGPTLLTMFVSGLWHGAGYLFIAWGLLHGFYLVINHAWRLAAAKLWPNKERYARVMRPVGFAITFVAVAVAMVLFRAPAVDVAGALLKGMVGWNGVGLGMSSPSSLVPALKWLALLLPIALLLPNSLQIIGRYEPALGVKPRALEATGWRAALTWSPSLVWAIATSALAAAAMLRIDGKSEFLYWQF